MKEVVSNKSNKPPYKEQEDKKLQDQGRRKGEEFLEMDYLNWRRKTYTKLVKYRKITNKQFNFCSDLSRRKKYQQRLAVLEKRITSFEDKEMKEVKEVEYPDIKIRFVYEQHYKEHNPDVVRGLDFYLKEFENIMARPTKQIIRKIELSNSINTLQAIQILGIPIYMIDLDGDITNATTEDLKLSFKKQVTIEKIVALITGGVILGVPIKTILSQKKLSRRDFLKKVFIVGGAVTVEAMANIPQIGFENINKDKHQRRLLKVHEVYEKIIEKFGLYNLVMTFRNAIFAQKILDINKFEKKKLKSNKKLHAGMQIGALHTGLEHFVGLDEKVRLQIIGELAKHLDLKDIETEIGLMVRLFYDKKTGRWHKKTMVNDKIVRAVRNAKRKDKV